MSLTRSNSLILSGASLLTILLVWFSIVDYRSASPVAEAMQKGLALSLGQAIEVVAARDPSFAALEAFSSSDIAYFALLDSQGTILFHTNRDLLGESVSDSRYQSVFSGGEFLAKRRRLGTGEEIYESHLPIHLPERTLALRLALHTWQADAVVRRARAGLAMLLSLVCVAWGTGLFALHLQRRDLKRRAELTRHEHLARLGELGAVLAHEVRTPLAGIKGYAQLLQERLQEPRQQQYASRIVNESVRLEGLVNDLLLYVRQESFAEGEVMVKEAIKSAWDSLATLAEKSNVELTVEGVGEYPVACPADRLHQILLNLFSNAIQAMQDGGRLRVSSFSNSEQVTILIADSGPGFVAETLQRAFDPFYTTRASGSGLGLAVCRKLAEGYGGSITAANGSDGGAEITLKLPHSRGDYE